ncbi:MAG: hypothetical protein KDA57_10530 [Planctomycetales bacterium]|nr:hypothetical protein [Planctomycetales bacterium]
MFTADCRAEWLTRVDVQDGKGEVLLGAEPELFFLVFGEHSYAPDDYLATTGESYSEQLSVGKDYPIALFQGLNARQVTFLDALAGKEVQVTKSTRRDAFWDQVITVTPGVDFVDSKYELIEAGVAGEALPRNLRQLRRSAEQVEKQQQSLVDPHIPPAIDRELSWAELESMALPLDFQKVLVASPNDASPGFVFQNGQWLTTWLSRDLPKWTKEDHWFAPALLIDGKLIRPAPLSAKTGFATSNTGATLPRWTLEWSYQEISVRQSIFSYPSAAGNPEVYVQLHLENAPTGVRLALGVGRRPNVHYWDNREHERTPIPFFTLPAGYRQQGQRLIDRWDNLIIESAQDFRLEQLGPVEMLLTFDADERGDVYLRSPQVETSASAKRFGVSDFHTVSQAFEEYWYGFLHTGAQVSLPSAEWMKRIDIWKSQLAAITRVHYQNQERLSYGAYFYQAYFGPEEGWPIVALAQWGHAAEAQRQAEIMLSEENRSKENVHHQSRNGAFAWYATEVARLTNDSDWLQSIAPALIENADWTIAQCKSTESNGSPVTRGLLPPHIYGGDIRDPATSLYATAVCWKGLAETAEILRTMGSAEQNARAGRYGVEALRLKRRLAEVIQQVVDASSTPPFLPLALALPSLDGNHEGPYERLTESKLGNYWNLFAPSVLELGLVAAADRSPNRWLLDYQQSHGGLWAGLPRFHNGLDAAYSIGVINELISRSIRDVRYRNQALASLQSFFLHAASRNGYTIPEVAGLFPYRLDTEAYQRLVRESPWNFGMYDAERYLQGHISFTEPLGAAAGEALWMIRNALVAETRNETGDFDGGLFLLSTVPGDWFAEGQEIVLTDFPTYCGMLSIRVLSKIESNREIAIDYEFTPNGRRELNSIVVRFAPPGHVPQDVRMTPAGRGVIQVKFPE